MLKLYERDFIWWNAVFAGALSNLVLGYHMYGAWPLKFRQIDYLNDFFVTLASVAGVLAGFTIASFTFLAGYIDKPIFKALRANSESKKIWHTMNTLTVALFTITILSLVYLLLDFSSCIFNLYLVFLCLFSSLLMANLIFILNSFIDIDHSNPETPPQG